MATVGVKGLIALVSFEFLNCHSANRQL